MALTFNPDQLECRIQIPANLAALNLTAVTRPGNRLYVNGNPATSGQLVKASTWRSPVTVTAISQDWRLERK